MKIKIIFYMAALVLYFIMPLSSFSETRPDWLNGVSSTYPKERYLTGVGFGESRKIAEEQAYAAVSKIFSARITSVNKDYERYSLKKSAGQKAVIEELSLEQSTEVTTDKVLENITIAGTWHDSAEETYYVLAIIDRVKAANAIKEKISSLDSEIGEMARSGRASADKIQKIRNLNGVIKRLVRREAYNGDLRIINLYGKGMDTSFILAELTDELDNFLKNDFSIGVEITGDRDDIIRSAVTEGLNNMGFSIAKNGLGVDLLVHGDVDLKEADVQNPRFKFIRCSAEFKLIEKSTDNVIGTITKSDRAGHLNLKEAEKKALMALKNEITKEINNKIAGFIYREN